MFKTLHPLFFLLLIMGYFLFYDGNEKIAIGEKMIKFSNIYVYKNDDIKNFLFSTKSNAKFILQNISRNSSGTALYIQYSPKNNMSQKILIVPSNDKIKEIFSPAKIAYFDDNAEIVAWSNNLSKDIHFRNGKSRNMIKIGEFGSGSFCIDPSGRYFAIEVKPGITEIVSTENPDQLLFQVKSRIDKIFFANDKLYLFDYDNNNYMKKNRSEKINCLIYKKLNSSYKLEDELQILRPSARPSPFFVVDMDLESEQILVEDVRDNPLSFLTSWFLYDIKIKKMEEITRSQGTHVFFLKEDILKKRIEMQDRE